jgi:hypothetical protein
VNRAIELHDTRVGRIETIGDDVVVELSPAYVHKWDAGTGVWQNAVLRFAGGSIEADRPTLPEALWDGTLRAGGRESPDLIPIPAPSGPAELLLTFVTGHVLTIRGESIALELIGEEFDEEKGPGG